MNSAMLRAMLLLLHFALACGPVNGFSIPEPSGAAQVVGRALWPGGRSAASATVHAVVDGQSAARVTTDERGQFVFRDAPTGPAHIVVNAGQGMGALSSIEIFSGGVNDAGDLFLEPMHLAPAVFGFRGVDAEERWTTDEGSINEIDIHPEGAWFIASRFVSPGPSYALPPRLSAISRETGEERTLAATFSGAEFWSTANGVVFIADGSPVSIDVDGQSRTGPPLPPWSQSTNGRRSHGRYAAFIRRPTSSTDASGVVVLDLESLSSREVVTFESEGPYSEERLDEFISRAPRDMRVDASGRWVVLSRRVLGLNERLEERLTRVDTTNSALADLWSAPCPAVSASYFSCLLGFHVSADGRVLATIVESGRTRYLEWDADSDTPRELTLLDPLGEALHLDCSDNRWSFLEACFVRYGAGASLFVNAPRLDAAGGVETWMRHDIAEGIATRSFDLGLTPPYFPDGTVLTSGGTREIDAWDRRGEDGFKQVWTAPAGAQPEVFQPSTFFPSDHRAVAFSPDAAHIYYLAADPETGYTQLFRAPVGGSGAVAGGGR